MYDQQPFVQAMEKACNEIYAGVIQEWIRHSRCFFPQCLAREDTACDVNDAHFFCNFQFGLLYFVSIILLILM